MAVLATVLAGCATSSASEPAAVRETRAKLEAITELARAHGMVHREYRPGPKDRMRIDVVPATLNAAMVGLDGACSNNADGRNIICSRTIDAQPNRLWVFLSFEHDETGFVFVEAHALPTK
jgi:hypothetical protein